LADSFAASGGARHSKIKAHFIYRRLMKYNSKTKMLEFSADESVFKFHDQLTEIMRFAMSRVGGDATSEGEAIGLTREFFEQYSALSDALRCLRAHMPRGEIR
jgi:hypothetical protein